MYRKMLFSWYDRIIMYKKSCFLYKLTGLVGGVARYFLCFIEKHRIGRYNYYVNRPLMDVFANIPEISEND